MIKKTENKVLTHPCLTPLEMENFSKQMNCIKPRKTCERKTNKQTKKLKVGSESNFSVTSTWPVRCFWRYWMLHSTLQIPSNLRFVSVAAFIRRIERFSTNRTEIHFGRFHVSSDLCQSISISVCWCRIAFACWTICKGDIYCLFNQVLVNCTFRMHLEREKKNVQGSSSKHHVELIPGYVVTGLRRKTLIFQWPYRRGTGRFTKSVIFSVTFWHSPMVKRISGLCIM